MDTLVKALELGAKYAWSAFVVSAILLLLPDTVVARLDLLNLRRANIGYLWITLLFFGMLAFSGAIPTVRKYLWRYVLCPFKKLLFPITDLRSKIKQSRIRYFRVQFSYRDGEKPIYYEAISSNGVGCGFFNEQGQRVLPTEPNDGHVRLDEGTFQHPQWGRVDWSDVFNGQTNTGVWGIAER